MARILGDRLPDVLRSLLAGREIESGASSTTTLLLLTVDQDGWPRQAMISLGELVALSPVELGLALWPDSTTTGNLTRTGQATLTLVHQAIAYSLRCDAERQADLELPLSGRLAHFVLRIVAVLADEVPYAELTAGVGYRLLQPDLVLPRWRETIAALMGSAARPTTL
jgi:hypothetical protein